MKISIGASDFNDNSNIDSNMIPNFRRRCIYVPQALPPMQGTPETFIKEFLEYNCRKDEKGSLQGLKGKFLC